MSRHYRTQRENLGRSNLRYLVVESERPKSGEQVLSNVDLLFDFEPGNALFEQLYLREFICEKS
jgi:hypothetical protein